MVNFLIVGIWELGWNRFLRGFCYNWRGRWSLITFDDIYYYININGRILLDLAQNGANPGKLVSFCLVVAPELLLSKRRLWLYLLNVASLFLLLPRSGRNVRTPVIPILEFILCFFLFKGLKRGIFYLFDLTFLVGKFLPLLRFCCAVAIATLDKTCLINFWVTTLFHYYLLLKFI